MEGEENDDESVSSQTLAEFFDENGGYFIREVIKPTNDWVDLREDGGADFRSRLGGRVYALGTHDGC